MSPSSKNTRAGEGILSAVMQNPEGLLLVAAGAALLMRKSGSSMASDRNGGSRSFAVPGSQTFKKAASSVQDYASDAKGYASDMTHRTKEAVGSAAAYAGQAGRAMGERSSQVLQGTQTALQRVLQDQPLMIAVAGLAIGAAAAATFPATDLERERLGPLGEQMTDMASEVGDRLKEATARAGEALKNAADERGLNAGGLKDVAGEVADAFSGTTKGANAKSSAGSDPGP